MGTFEATEVTISSEISGKIHALAIQEGQLLQAGVPVGTIDTVPLALERELLKRKREVLKSRQADIPKQVAAIHAQIAAAQGERRRFDNLVQMNAANRKQVDDLDAQIAVLERQLIAQTATLEEHNRGVAAELAALEIEIARVDDRLARCRIVSPIHGTVLAKYAEAGEVTLAGKALFKVGDTDNMFLRAYVTSSQLSRVQLGESVKLFTELDDDDRRAYTGRVVWISDKAEFTPKSVQTRDERANQVYAIKIATRNDGWLKIGMYGEIQFEE
jgi:HlyD family secretion protein